MTHNKTVDGIHVVRSGFIKHKPYLDLIPHYCLHSDNKTVATECSDTCTIDKKSLVVQQETVKLILCKCGAKENK